MKLSAGGVDGSESKEGMTDKRAAAPSSDRRCSTPEQPRLPGGKIPIPISISIFSSFLKTRWVHLLIFHHFSSQCQSQCRGRDDVCVGGLGRGRLAECSYPLRPSLTTIETMH